MEAKRHDQDSKGETSVIIYRSLASPAFGYNEIHEMLYKAKRFNAERDISGFILYANGSFVQLIEGRNQEISALYRSIQNDTRHKDVTTLLDQKNEGRLFKDWFMSYYDFSTMNKRSEHKRLLLESYLSQVPSTAGMQQTLKVLRSTIQDIMQIDAAIY